MTDANDRSEAEVIQLAQARSAALIHKDAQAIDQLLAAEFVYTNAAGMILTKAGYLEAYVEQPDLHWQSQDLDEIYVRLYGFAAILTCRVHDQGVAGIEPFDAYFRSTFVWINQPERWQGVSGHTTATDRPG
jgi:hypothetical protein